MSLSVRTGRVEGAGVHEAARALRVGGQTVPPGASRVLSVALPGRADVSDALPVWVAAGARPGPRVTVVAAPRGFEVAPARVAAALRAMIVPADLHGGLVVVPVLRPGGRFVARGLALPERAAWRFPGDPGGKRRAREAFAVFSDVAVGSALLLVLTAADPGLTAPLTIHGDFEDPRARRFLPHLPTAVAVHTKPAPGSLMAAAADLGAVVLQLTAPTAMTTSTESTGDQALMAAVLGVLAAAGASASNGAEGVASVPPAMVTHATAVHAPVGGFLEQVADAGNLVDRGSLLARVVPALTGRSVDVLAPHDGVVLQATTRVGVRVGAPLFIVGRLSSSEMGRTRVRLKRAAHTVATPLVPGPTVSAALTGAAADAHPMRVGWVERVSLPGLGVDRMRAKIDTGARTSALHVTRMTTVGMTDGPHRRAIVELTLPAGSRRGAPSTTVRALVRDHVQVKDTSGRTERRPVIETTLRLGNIERRIRVTLTNRGDMLFPLLIGRTALGSGVVVDPAHRLLLRQEPALRRKARPRTKKTKTRES